MVNVLTDLLLQPPVAGPWLRWLLAATFTLHFVFVLIMLGSALITLNFHLVGRRVVHEDLDHWDRWMHRRFVLSKAMAVVLGVGALLVTQLFFGLPFFTSVVLFGPWWLWVFVAMIVAFVLLETANHTYYTHPGVSIATNVVGTFILIGIPAVFVTVLVGMEYSDRWIAMVRNGFGFDGELVFHWLARYLHVIGAAVATAAAYQYLATTHGREWRRRAMLRWIAAGLLVQFVTGGALAVTLHEWLSNWVLLPLTIGILSAVVLLWIVGGRLIGARAGAVAPARAATLGVNVFLMFAVLAGMVVTRQYIQQQKVLTLLDKSKAAARDYEAVLAPYDARQAGTLDEHLTVVYDRGDVIFANSCSVCHGLNGAGDGPSGLRLTVPPERVAQIRADRGIVRTAILNGVPGTGMPYFSIYDRGKINGIMDYFGQRFQAFEAPGPPPVPVSADAKAKADQFFVSACALCHGLDGRRSKYAAGFNPAPPDLTKYNLTPQRTYEVISDGYPGTPMQPFGWLPEETRWGLVAKVNALLGAPAPPPEKGGRAEPGGKKRSSERKPESKGGQEKKT